MRKIWFWQKIAHLLRRTPMLMSIAHVGMRWFQPKFSVGVVGVVVNEHGQVLIVEHVFHPTAPWGLPGGWINRGETPAQCAVREIYEELALKVSIEQVLAVETTFARHLDFAYLCRPQGEVGALSFELLNYRWCDPRQLPPLLTFHQHAINQFLQLMDASTYGSQNS